MSGSVKRSAGPNRCGKMSASPNDLPPKKNVIVSCEWHVHMICISLVRESRQLLALALLPHLQKSPHLWHSCRIATVFAKYNATHAQTNKDGNIHQPN